LLRPKSSLYLSRLAVHGPGLTLRLGVLGSPTADDKTGSDDDDDDDDDEDDNDEDKDDNSNDDDDRQEGDEDGVGSP
jgi:hypothetical protein